MTSMTWRCCVAVVLWEYVVSCPVLGVSEEQQSDCKELVFSQIRCAVRSRWPGRVKAAQSLPLRYPGPRPSQLTRKVWRVSVYFVCFVSVKTFFLLKLDCVGHWFGGYFTSVFWVWGICHVWYLLGYQWFVGFVLFTVGTCFLCCKSIQQNVENFPWIEKGHPCSWGHYFSLLPQNLFVDLKEASYRMWACGTESWHPGLWLQVGHSVGCRPWTRKTLRPSHRAQKNSPTPPTERRTIRMYVGWSNSFLFHHAANVVVSPSQRGRNTPRWIMYSCSQQACPVLPCFTLKDELHSSSFFFCFFVSLPPSLSPSL